MALLASVAGRAIAPEFVKRQIRHHTLPALGACIDYHLVGARQNVAQCLDIKPAAGHIGRCDVCPLTRRFRPLYPRKRTSIAMGDYGRFWPKTDIRCAAKRQSHRAVDAPAPIAQTKKPVHSLVRRTEPSQFGGESLLDVAGDGIVTLIGGGSK